MTRLSHLNATLVTYAETLNPEKTLFTVWQNDDLTNSTRDDSTGLFTREFLFQNYQACIESRASLANATSIGFSSNTANVSFCLEDFSLLPTQVPSAGEVQVQDVAPSLPHISPQPLTHACATPPPPRGPSPCLPQEAVLGYKQVSYMYSMGQPAPLQICLATQSFLSVLFFCGACHVLLTPTALRATQG